MKSVFAKFCYTFWTHVNLNSSFGLVFTLKFEMEIRLEHDRELKTNVA